MSATTTVTQSALTLRATEEKKASTGSTRPQKLRWWGETGEPEEAYPYRHFLPFFDKELRLPPLTPFKHFDPGHDALKHEDPQSFLANADVDELTPDFGSEVSGIQLHELDTVGRQQLALYVAQRGVVVSPRLVCRTSSPRVLIVPRNSQAFRDQDFADQDQTWMIQDWCRFFGRPHIHPCSGAPKGHPEFHLV